MWGQSSLNDMLSSTCCPYAFGLCLHQIFVGHLLSQAQTDVHFPHMNITSKGVEKGLLDCFLFFANYSPLPLPVSDEPDPSLDHFSVGLSQSLAATSLMIASKNCLPNCMSSFPSSSDILVGDSNRYKRRAAWDFLLLGEPHGKIQSCACLIVMPQTPPQLTVYVETLLHAPFLCMCSPERHTGLCSESRESITHMLTPFNGTLNSIVKVSLQSLLC